MAIWSHTLCFVIRCLLRTYIYMNEKFGKTVAHPCSAYSCTVSFHLQMPFETRWIQVQWCKQLQTTVWKPLIISHDLAASCPCLQGSLERSPGLWPPRLPPTEMSLEAKWDVFCMTHRSFGFLSSSFCEMRFRTKLEKTKKGSKSHVI